MVLLFSFRKDYDVIFILFSFVLLWLVSIILFYLSSSNCIHSIFIFLPFYCLIILIFPFLQLFLFTLIFILIFFVILSFYLTSFNCSFFFKFSLFLIICFYFSSFIVCFISSADYFIFCLIHLIFVFVFYLAAVQLPRVVDFGSCWKSTDQNLQSIGACIVFINILVFRKYKFVLIIFVWVKAPRAQKYNSSKKTLFDF